MTTATPEWVAKNRKGYNAMPGFVDGRVRLSQEQARDLVVSTC